MKLLIIIFLVVIAAMGVRAFSSPKTLDTDGGLVSLDDISRLVARLEADGQDGSFWVLPIPDTAGKDGYDANLQVSIEDGAIGLDWVLIAERNVNDKAQFLKIAAEHGLEVKSLAGNGVDYLRIEESTNIAELSKYLLQKMYNVNDTTKMQLIITGFNWP